jgi:hypothetical protein
MSIRGRYGSSLELDPEEPAPLESVFLNSTLEKFSLLASPANASTAKPEFCCTVVIKYWVNLVYLGFTSQQHSKGHMVTFQFYWRRRSQLPFRALFQAQTGT